VIFNLRDGELDHADPRAEREGHTFRRAMPARRVGAQLTGLSVYELPPGQAGWAYHYELNREEWLVVVSGELVLRTPGGEERLVAGDVRCFPVGPDGAHAVRNESDAPARFAMPSSFPPHAYVAMRPDSNTAFIVGPGVRQIVPLDEALDYWAREP
jgi:uncharacterized cupin superfamily protein